MHRARRRPGPHQFPQVGMLGSGLPATIAFTSPKLSRNPHRQQISRGHLHGHSSEPERPPPLVQAINPPGLGAAVRGIRSPAFARRAVVPTTRSLRLHAWRAGRLEPLHVAVDARSRAEAQGRPFRRATRHTCAGTEWRRRAGRRRGETADSALAEPPPQRRLCDQGSSPAARAGPSRTGTRHTSEPGRPISGTHGCRRAQAAARTPRPPSRTSGSPRDGWRARRCRTPSRWRACHVACPGTPPLEVAPPRASGDIVRADPEEACAATEPCRGLRELDQSLLQNDPARRRRQQRPPP